MSATTLSPQPHLDRARPRDPAVRQDAAAADRPAGQGANRELRSSLNEILADTTILYALYKKHHWLVAGPTFYQLHLLFDKHAEEQLELVDLLAERVQTWAASPSATRATPPS